MPPKIAPTIQAAAPISNIALAVNNLPAGDDTDSSDGEAYDESLKKGGKGTPQKHASGDALSEHARRRLEMREKIVKEILENVMPDIGAYDVDGMAPRSTKTKHWLIDVCKFLGCWSLNLHESVENGSLLYLQLAIKKLMEGKRANPNLINSYDEQGRTALSLAVKTSRDDMVAELMGADALTDLYDEQTGRSPLMHSVLNQTHVISEMLLSANADYNMCDFKCVTPLMLAAQNNDVRHCRMLLAKPRIEVDCQDENGWSALHYAAFGNAPGACAELIEAGSDRNLRDLKKRKPIHIARFQNFGDCIAALEDLKSKLAFAVGDVDD